MKRLFLLYLLFFHYSSFGQDYVPLLNNYNEWHFTTCHFGCLTDTYFTDGDTIVGGTDYKILDGYHFISRTLLLREELLERRVYLNLVEASGNIEYLLYDFSIAIGDSIDMKNPYSPFILNAGYYQLDSVIPRQLVDGNNYRHFYLSPTASNTISTTNAVWIEGAGSLSLITAPSGFPDINAVGQLSCYFKNSQSFYANLDSIDACEPLIVLNQNEFNNALSEVQVITQISNNSCQILNAANVKFIDLYDLHGRKLVDLTNNGQEVLNIDLSGYNPGVYILVTSTKHFKKRTFKIIID